MQEHLQQAHAAWLAARDRAHGVESASPEERIRRARVGVIAQGLAGVWAVQHLASQPLALLTVSCIFEDERAALQQIRLSQPKATMRILPGVHRTSLPYLMEPYDFVLVAAERPLPALLANLNRDCYNNRLPWSALTVWGAETTLGPTVLPPATACYDCYQARLLANAARPDVFKATDAFFRADDHVRARGRLLPLSRRAAALAAGEVLRFISGSAAPASIGHELRYIGLGPQGERSYCVPFEQCATCRDKRQDIAPTDTLAACIARVLQQEEAHALR